jgi:hypothetical protein
MMSAMKFSNVVLESNVDKFVTTHGLARDKVLAHPMLEPVIEKLAVLYPLWKFEGSGAHSVSMNNQSTLWLTNFDVSCDGEPLGVITRRYEGRDYQICVTNERIKAKMERTNYYKTKDPSKAVAKVKKMFGPNDTQEMARIARGKAGAVAQDAEWSKNRELGAATEIVQRAAKKYVMGAGFEAFMAYVKDHYPAQEYELLVTNHEVAEKARVELETIKATQGVISTQKKGAVVTRRGSTYVVEQSDKVEICDDNTLPEWIQSRIGMLKLIEPAQFVSDLGMRANENVFVLIEPTEPNLTDVTEGETK